MARQKGIIKLNGTIGDITFYKSKDGYLAREKGGVPADRIANDPVFQRIRENGAEFGRAGLAGKVLRNALRNLLQNAADSKMVSRLSQEMVKVIQKDITNPRGLRNVMTEKQNYWRVLTSTSMVSWVLLCMRRLPRPLTGWLVP
jgi:hypothetical protein